MFNKKSYFKNLNLVKLVIKKIRAGPTGIEPAAAWLKAKRSARLSYGP